MVSHELGMVAHHATCVICLKRRVVAQGAPRDVLTGPVLQSLFGMHMGLICADSHTHRAPDLTPELTPYDASAALPLSSLDASAKSANDATVASADDDSTDNEKEDSHV